MWCLDVRVVRTSDLLEAITAPDVEVLVLSLS